MKLRDANLQVNKKNFFTNPPSCILPSFSKNASRLLLPKRLLKVWSKIFFRKNEQGAAILVTYLLNHDSSKSTSFMLNMVFGFVLSTVFVKQIGISCNTLQGLQKRSSFLSLCFDWYVVFFDKKLIFLHYGDNTFLLFWHLYQTHTHFQQ